MLRDYNIYCKPNSGSRGGYKAKGDKVRFACCNKQVFFPLTNTFFAKLYYEALYKFKSHPHLEGMLLFSILKKKVVLVLVSKACLLNILWKRYIFSSFHENSNQTFLKICIKSFFFTNMITIVCQKKPALIIVLRPIVLYALYRSYLFIGIRNCSEN